MSETPLSRRRALRIGGGGALALVIGGAAGWADRRGGEPQTAPPPTGPVTTSTAPRVAIPEIGEVDPRVVGVGRRVIEVTGEGDLTALLAALPATTGDPVVAAASRIRAEFAAGDTVRVDGWILAASEARASAVIALLCQQSGC